MSQGMYLLLVTWLAVSLAQSYLILHFSIIFILPIVTFFGYYRSISQLTVPISLLAVALVKVFAILSLTRFNLVYFSVNSSVIFI